MCLGESMSLIRRSFSAVIAVCIAGSCSLAPFAAGAESNLPGNLNLGSVTRTYVEPQGTPSAQIIVGGRPVTVSAGMAVTPAEAAAVSQVLSNGVQTILLGRLGNAVGGTFVAPTANNFSAISVPHGLTI